MKIYISGKISGLSPGEYTPLFRGAEQRLATQGHEIINPLDVAVAKEDVDPARHTEADIWRNFMRADIKLLTDCDAIYMLRNWEESDGAGLEHHIAQGLGLKVIYEQEPRHHDIKTTIAAVMGVPFKIIAQDSRNRWHVYARMIYAHHARKNGDTTKVIADETHHDQSSVCYYLRHYEIEYRYNREFRNVAEKIATLLSEKLKHYNTECTPPKWQINAIEPKNKPTWRTKRKRR